MKWFFNVKEVFFVDISIIIVNWNSAPLLEQCLASIEKRLTNVQYEAFVVDNCSAAADISVLQETLEPKYGWAKFIYNKENLGFAKANNLVIDRCRGEYVLLLNPDTCFTEDGFAGFLQTVKNSDSGIAGCKLLNADKTTQVSCFYFPGVGRAALTALLLHKVLPAKLRRKVSFSPADHDFPQEPDWLMGAFMLLKRDVLKKIGGFDESIFMYGEDMDLCYKVKKLGLPVKYFPEFAIIHYGGSSGKQAWSDAQKESMVYRAVFAFYRKYYGSGSLLAARFFYALGALLKMLIYALGSLRPGRLKRGVHEVNTQWHVFTTQLRRWQH